MKRVSCLLFVSLLSGCSLFNPLSYEEEQKEISEKYAKQAKDANKIISDAVNRGDLKISLEYLAPNLTGGRWFKVEDQYGCKWWIDSGNKFDHEQLDVIDKNTANCPNQDFAPDPETIYRDRNGQVIDPADYVEHHHSFFSQR